MRGLNSCKGSMSQEETLERNTANKTQDRVWRKDSRTPTPMFISVLYYGSQFYIQNVVELLYVLLWSHVWQSPTNHNSGPSTTSRDVNVSSDSPTWFLNQRYLNSNWHPWNFSWRFPSTILRVFLSVVLSQPIDKHDSVKGPGPFPPSRSRILSRTVYHPRVILSDTYLLTCLLM